MRPLSLPLAGRGFNARRCGRFIGPCQSLSRAKKSGRRGLSGVRDGAHTARHGSHRVMVRARHGCGPTGGRGNFTVQGSVHRGMNVSSSARKLKTTSACFLAAHSRHVGEGRSPTLRHAGCRFPPRHPFQQVAIPIETDSAPAPKIHPSWLLRDTAREAIRLHAGPRQPRRSSTGGPAAPSVRSLCGQTVRAAHPEAADRRSCR